MVAYFLIVIYLACMHLVRAVVRCETISHLDTNTLIWILLKDSLHCKTAKKELV